MRLQIISQQNGLSGKIFFSADSNDNILVMDAEGVLLGRINYWTNEGNWTDWQGREVSNTHYSYNFHDGDWNYFGSSGGYFRTVAFEADDERADVTVVTEAVEVLDETGTDVRYRVEDPGEGLNPGDDLALNI